MLSTRKILRRFFAAPTASLPTGDAATGIRSSPGELRRNMSQHAKIP